MSEPKLCQVSGCTEPRWSPAPAARWCSHHRDPATRDETLSLDRELRDLSRAVARARRALRDHGLEELDP
ncbi:MAG: hypothetical protein AAF851_06305 [Myxococcota bacterium]